MAALRSSSHDRRRARSDAPYQRLNIESQASAGAMLAGFGAAYYQPAAEEFLVVQLFHGASRFVDGLHLYERKTF